jgi:hypothetical protein
LPTEPELGSHIVKVRFTEALVGEQPLCSLQYLFPPAGDLAAPALVGHYTVEKVGSRITSVASTHSSPFVSLLSGMNILLAGRQGMVADGCGCRH